MQELYDLIGCDLVELIQLDRGIIMAVDEEGKLKEIKGGFTFLGWGTVIAGTGIVLGGDSKSMGDQRIIARTLESYKERSRFESLFQKMVLESYAFPPEAGVRGSKETEKAFTGHYCGSPAWNFQHRNRRSEQQNRSG